MASRRDQIRHAAEALLGVAVTAPPVRTERGFGNENWRVACGDRALLVKVAPAGAHLGKAEGASRALRLAVRHGARVPREVHFEPSCAALDGRLVRIMEYVDGVHPEALLTSPAGIRVFFEDLGRTVALLHRAPCDGFSSRVGGSPVFATWAEYVDYRVPQILGRAVRTDLYPPAAWEAMFARARALAARVSAVVEPRLTHRDLYLDNVVADPGGGVAAIIDFDIAEAWDPAADLVKLRWQVFPRYPGAAEAYRSGYTADGGRLPMLAERVRVAEVLELANHAANASLDGNTAFAASARTRLDQVLASPWP